MLFFGDVVSMVDFDPEDFAVGLGDGLGVDCAVDRGVGCATDGTGAMTSAKVAASTNRVGWMGRTQRGK